MEDKIYDALARVILREKKDLACKKVINNHVPSFDLCIRLEELGLKNTCFSWYSVVESNGKNEKEVWYVDYSPKDNELDTSICVAPLASEIMEVLPNTIISKIAGGYRATTLGRGEYPSFSVSEDNFTETLAMLLIFALENKFSNLKEKE